MTIDGETSLRELLRLKLAYTFEALVVFDETFSLQNWLTTNKFILTN